MKLFQIIISLFFLLNACGANQNQKVDKEGFSEHEPTGFQSIDGPDTNVIYQQKDSIILENILEELAALKDSPTPALLKKAGEFFRETPYVAHTLEADREQLIINLRELDCTTYAENCLALANTVKNDNPSLEKFANELQRVRYRNGQLNGYPSRLHYFSDWISENEKKGLVKDVSKEIANTPYPKTVNFMSTHPESYKQLKNSSELVKKIAEKENEISAREMYYIPESRIGEVDHLLEEGDIAGVTTGIEGLDISHVVILIRKNGKIHPMHASTAAGKVVVDKATLEEYLLKSKSATGVMVARPI
ncbi:MAG TPA: N-acetylmuramoyl-L-alanine amidase-like domain-containing protein [Prolixibacteraceae bacterium]|nr:N-acetylmuramoyl-L-alanine amidase-like domain-containing protein [Prolixibacteraceae bacterium]